MKLKNPLTGVGPVWANSLTSEREQLLSLEPQPPPPPGKNVCCHTAKFTIRVGKPRGEMEKGKGSQSNGGHFYIHAEGMNWCGTL